MAKILVIDDESQIRQMVSRILVEGGHEVTEASNGAEGLKLFREVLPDLVVADLFMPVKEGIETIFELRRETPDVKIIAMSGGGSRRDLGSLAAARALGADLTLAKPFRAAQLLEACAGLLARPST